MQINAQLPVIGLPDDDWHKFRWLQIEPIDLPIHGNYFLSTCKNFRAGGIPSEHFHFIFPANNFLLSKAKTPETKAVFRCKLEAHDLRPPLRAIRQSQHHLAKTKIMAAGNSHI